MWCRDVFSRRVVEAFRAKPEQIAEMYAQYPKMKEHIDLFTKEISEKKFEYRKVRNLKQLIDTADLSGNDDHFRANYKNLNPKLKKSLIRVYNDMINGPKFAAYIKELMEDSAVYMMLNKDVQVRNFADLSLVRIDRTGPRVSKENYLERGFIDNQSVMKILVDRLRERGEVFTVIHDDGMESNPTRNQVYRDFHSVPHRGPFFDNVFSKEDSHGQATHMLQMDYTAKTVHEATKGDPRIFWDYVATNQHENLDRVGGWAWDTFYDGLNSTLMEPEYVKPLVYKYIQLF